MGEGYLSFLLGRVCRAGVGEISLLCLYREVRGGKSARERTWSARCGGVEVLLNGGCYAAAGGLVAGICGEADGEYRESEGMDVVFGQGTQK